MCYEGTLPRLDQHFINPDINWYTPSPQLNTVVAASCCGNAPVCKLVGIYRKIAGTNTIYSSSRRCEYIRTTVNSVPVNVDVEDDRRTYSKHCFK